MKTKIRKWNNGVWDMNKNGILVARAHFPPDGNPEYQNVIALQRPRMIRAAEIAVVDLSELLK